MTPLRSPNFGFLATHDPLLLKLAAQAERFCFEEPGLSLVRLRQLTEAMAMEAVAATGGFPKTASEPDLLGAIRLLEQRNAIGRETAQVFHHLRQSGNRAVHEDFGTQRDALHALKLGLHAAVWFHRTLGNPAFKTRAFVPPPEPHHADAALRDELEDLRAQLASATNEAQAAAGTAAEEAELRRKAEADAAKAYADLQAALELAEESEAKLEAARFEFREAMKAAPVALTAEVQQTLAFATQADAALSGELD